MLIFIAFFIVVTLLAIGGVNILGAIGGGLDLWFCGICVGIAIYCICLAIRDGKK
jgi:hypothetical protein